MSSPQSRKAAPPAKSKPSSSSLVTNYLLAYNGLSFLGWLVVLGRLVLLVPLVGTENVYSGLGDFTKWVQTFAILEVVHAAFGMWFGISRMKRY
jgi:very-long-chain (3R)-3-hydroxyacyl-CoA dehydratase